MSVRRLVVAVAATVTALGIIAADTAMAQSRKGKQKLVPAPPSCVDRPKPFSWNFLLPGNNAPQPNGCSPAVYDYGRYVGQDPDLNIRAYMRRDPASGYSGDAAQ